MATLSGVVSVRVVFNAGSVDDPLEWFNTHEVVTDGTTLTPTDVDAVAAAFVLFHRSLLLTPFRITRVVMSSYVPDSKPYNPETLAIRLFNARGTYMGADGATQALPLTNIIRIQRDVDMGRPGAMLLRGMVHESMIQSDPLTGAVGFQNINDVSDIVTDAHATLSATLAAHGCELVMAYGEPAATNVRSVKGLTVRGIGSKQLKNKVSPRYGGGLLGDIMRAIDTVADNEAALELIKDALRTLEFLAPLLVA